MKININNKEKMDSEFKKVNARVRGASSYDVENLVNIIEINLGLKGVPKKYWTGLKFRCNPNPETFPHAYKGIPMATYFTLERYPSGWFLVGVERRECKMDFITLVSGLSEEQKQGVLDAFYKF